MLKELFQTARQEKARAEKMRGEATYPSLSIALFDAGQVYQLRQEEIKALLQEAIYLLRDYSKNAEVELMQMVEEYHEELFDEE